MTQSRILDRKGDETERHICEIPKRILLVSWGRDTSRPALNDVGSWGHGDLMCLCCERGEDSGCRRKFDRRVSFCGQPSGTCF